MLQTLTNGKYLNHFDEQCLRDEIKENDETTVEQFLSKLSELKIEGKRSKDPVETFSM